MTKWGKLFRRVGALALSAAVLWGVGVTAGSDTAAAAAEAVGTALTRRAQNFRTADGLSAAAVLTLAQSPLLLAARPQVAAARQQEALPPEEAPPPAEEIQEAEEETVTVPPTKEEPTPPAVSGAVDNGVDARTLVPDSAAGYTVCGPVYISNATDHALSVTDVQQPFAAALSGSGPQVLILHTHGSESYTPAEDEGIVWSGEYRTTDARYNVVRVGDIIADTLAEAGISVLHDRTLYDYPNYSGAYDRSLAAIESYLAQYPSVQFILDVHRDAVEDGEGNQCKVISETTAGTAAQLTIVVGSDGSGLEHPEWMENLRLATAIQSEVLRENPTLMRPVLLRNSRYNQHAAPGSLLVEVGAAGNAPEEAQLAAKLFAESMAEVLQARSK